MSANQVYRLHLRASDHRFQVQALVTAKDGQPVPSAPTEEPVSAAIIGYWIELVGQDCQVIYRKFLNNLPLNLPHIWQQWGKRKRNRAHFYIEVPALPDAQFLKLYEQSLDSPAQRLPQRQKHFQLPIDATLKTFGGQSITSF